MQICEYFFENACYSVTKYYLCKQNNKRSLLDRKQRHQVVRSFPNRYLFSFTNKVTCLFPISCILEIILSGNCMQIVLQCFTKRETRTHQKEPLALYKGFCFCFVWVCRTVGKAQNFFFLFAETSASLKILFWRLPNYRQVVFYFSDVCRTIGKALFILFSFAETPARHKFSF